MTNIDLIVTHVADDQNKYRILIKSNYNYLATEDIQYVTNKIVDLIAPKIDYDYQNRMWWQINLYTIGSGNTQINKLTELVNYCMNIESLLYDYLSKENIDENPSNFETYFLIELINDKTKTNKLVNLSPYTL